MGLIRIFVACGDERLRLALVLLLDHQPGMVVVGMADRLAGLINQIEGSQPDVLLIDEDLFSVPIPELLSELHKLEIEPNTIVLSTNLQHQAGLLEAGVDVIIAKDTPPDALLVALNKVLSSKTSRENFDP